MGCTSLDAVMVGEELTHVEPKAFSGTGLAQDDLSLPEGCTVDVTAFD